jgi:hypothetical protein
MGDGKSTLLIIVIIVIVVLVALWLLAGSGLNGGGCIGPRPDPVGGINTISRPNGEVEISWDAPENASRYKVYVNTCPRQELVSSKRLIKSGNQSGNRHKVGTCGGDCCPGTCDSCVSQSNYKSLIETDQTKITIETCEPCLCFLIVPYNSCGQAGPCNEVNFVNVQCTVSDIHAWIASDDCNGTIIKWDPPRCADTIHIWVDGQDIEQVDASEGQIKLEQIPSGLEIAVQAETPCGLGELVIIRPADLVLLQKKMVAGEKFDARAFALKRRKGRRPPQPRGRKAPERVPIRVKGRGVKYTM